MDISDTTQSPSKRQKLEMASSSVTMDHTLAGAPNAKHSNGVDIVCDYSKSSGEEHAREGACGITEFVSTDLLGFSGILKKRYALFGLL